MTDDVPASQRWRGRPVHSLLLQIFVFAIPIVASVAASTLASSLGPRPRTPLEFVAWWAVLTVIALVVLLAVDRLARRLLPLAALLKLSMLFPDRAPSRFRVARNAASVRKLQEQLAAARERGLKAEPVWAAETVLTLITALGHHDRRSRGHSERVHVYAELIADELDLPEFDRDRLRWAALLHDVGKLVIPSELLNKPEAPDDEEWHALRSHPKAGAELCAPLLPWLGEWGLAIEQHHEWFDGTGYPQKLAGHEISRAARLVAVADCYEVMTTSRTYKRALSPAAAREELARCAGTQFDPAIVRAFLNISLGRLRLAMGPLAILSTVPSMARLSSLFEPLARAGAVMGGAALLVGGSTMMPGANAAGTATLPIDKGHPTVIDVATAPDALNSIAVAQRGLTPHLGGDATWASSNPPPPVARAVAVAQPRDGKERGRPRDEPQRTSRDDDDDRRRPRSTAKGTQAADRPKRVTAPKPKATKPAKASADKPTKRPSRSGADKNDGSAQDRDDRGRRAGGASPTPPDSPPGKDANVAPPADPNPPRSSNANGRAW